MPFNTLEFVKSIFQLSIIYVRADHVFFLIKKLEKTRRKNADYNETERDDPRWERTCRKTKLSYKMHSITAFHPRAPLVLAAPRMVGRRPRMEIKTSAYVICWCVRTVSVRGGYKIYIRGRLRFWLCSSRGRKHLWKQLGIAWLEPWELMGWAKLDTAEAPHAVEHWDLHKLIHRRDGWVEYVIYMRACLENHFKLASKN